MPTQWSRCLIALLGVAQGAIGAPDFSVSGITDFLTDVAASIASHDKNGDGVLDFGELGDYAWMLVPLDRDHDGKLSDSELRRGMGKLSTMLFPSKPAEPSSSLAPDFVPPSEPRRAPQPLKAVDWAVDTLIPDSELALFDGSKKRLSMCAGERGTVVAILSASCPISRRFFPSLGRLEKEYTARGFRFVFLAAPGEDDVDGLKATGFSGPIARDQTGTLLHALKATHTTDVFVLDSARTLIYRGALDDQYGAGYNLDAPRRRYAAEALDAVLAGARPAVAATLAPGCDLELPRAPERRGEITWHNRISRIVQANCAECHRSGGIAPFPLESFDQFAKKAGTIRRVVGEGVMPPWFAPAPQPGAHTPWANDRRLPARDKEDILAWLANGRPPGDPKDAPLARRWPEGWVIGEPDLIIQLPQPFAVKAEGILPYHSAMVETRLTEDKWVTAWEVRPTAREVVHHALVYAYHPALVSIPGHEEKRGYLAAFVPGLEHAIYPDGMAKRLPAGSVIRFEIHYTPNGKATEDQMRLGLKFAKTPPANSVEVAGVANVALEIPPGASAHPQAAEWKVPGDVRLFALTPHMHMRGKAMRFEVLTPDGATRTLLDMPRYDFNWQIPGVYAEPLLVPAGSRIKVTGWFDNSVANPANPDPTATVRWGSQTNDEMLIGYIEYFRVK